MFGVWNQYFNFYNMFQRSDGTPLFAEPKEEEGMCVNAIDKPELRAPYRKNTYDYTPWLEASRPAKKVCVGGDALGAYYNSATVRSALNIPDDITQTWTGCLDEEQRETWSYTMLIQASQWIWVDL